VNYDVYLEYIILKVIPAIEAWFPQQHETNMRIHIQQNNAPSHFREGDLGWRNLIDHEVNWDFRLPEQTANSLDTNILDLLFFALIQKLQWSLDCACATTIDGLIVNIMRAWDHYNPHTLDCIWLSHMACMNEIMTCHGDNDYKLLHIQKGKLLDNRGVLPSSIDVSDDAGRTFMHIGLDVLDIPGYENVIL
jgi:hypothetical protein